MIKGIKIHKSYKCDLPTSWDELSMRQFYLLELWKEGQSDLIQALEILTGIPPNIWDKTNYNDFKEIILPNMEWIFTPPKMRKIRIPETLTIKDKEVKIPRNIEFETLGQKVAVDLKMSEYAVRYKDSSLLASFHQMTYLIAAYISPQLSGKDFDMTYAEEIKEQLYEEKALTLIPVGSFFLQKYTVFLIKRNRSRKAKEVLKKLMLILKNWMRLDFSGRGMH